MTESSKATEDVDHSNVKSRFMEALVMLDFVTSDAGQIIEVMLCSSLRLIASLATSQSYWA